MKRLISVLSLLAFAAGSATPAFAEQGLPPQAKAAGYYMLTFATDSFTPRNVAPVGGPNCSTDTNPAVLPCYAPGKQWYGWNWLSRSKNGKNGWPVPEGEARFKTVDGSNVIVLNGQNNGYANNATLASAARSTSSPFFVGTAFGGGAYFEGELAFDNNKVGNTATNGWPAFWLEPIEHLASSGYSPIPNWVDRTTWKNVAFNDETQGYRHGVEEAEMAPDHRHPVEHFAELDIFEYLAVKDNHYLGTIIDWYGNFGSRTCPRYCKVMNSFADKVVTVSPDLRWTDWHKFGLLWVPATNEKDGYVQFWFDNKPGKIYYYPKFVNDGGATNPNQEPSQSHASTTDGSNYTLSSDDTVACHNYRQGGGGLAHFLNAGNCSGKSWEYGVSDLMHYVILTGGSSTTPLYVRSVHVWQRDASQNWVNN